MQIYIGWTCRHCGFEEQIVRDSSRMSEAGAWLPGELPLKCSQCGQVSALLGLIYHFDRDIHAPAHGFRLP